MQEESFEIYGVYHMVCSARILRDSLVTVDDAVKQSDEVSRKQDDPRIGPSPLSSDPYGE